MKRKVLILILLMSILLAGCSAGGPTNAEAREIIYAIFVTDVKILGKRQCELTPQMEEKGYTNVWLVRYQTEGSDTNKESAIVLAESDSQELPWDIYSLGVSGKLLEVVCP